jgi:hypothetical protein
MVSSSGVNLRVTNAVFRDVSAWYHVVVVFDSNNATVANRVRVYVNGTEQTYSTSNDPGSGSGMYINRSATLNTIGQNGGSAGYLNSYLTEVNFIDGQALTPSSFGETDTNTGVWKPKAYSGTYGTNGFYVNFSDNSNTTAATLGKDYSGNGNNWTPNNFSVTAGVGNDSLVDSPTAYGTDTGVGGSVRGNYATLNPLAMTGTYSNGNLDFTTAAGDSTLVSTMAVSSGKWYCEFSPTAITANCQIGIVAATARNGFAPINTNQHPSIVYVSNTGNKFINGTGTSYGATYTTNDVIGVALDLDNLTIQFYKNGSAQGSITGVTASTYCFAVGDGDSVTTWSGWANFGQRAFAYTAPSGFKALCTTNLPTPTIGATSTTQANDYFDVTLYTGNNTAGRNITNSGSFQPDFVWIKNRSGTNNHILTDAVRGATKTLFSDSTSAELTVAGALTAFNSNGFQVGYDGTAIVNASANNYVGWQWNAGGSNQTISVGQYSTSPNVPSIASTVRANTTSGFSVVTFNAGASGAQSFGHGLGVVPKLVILKDMANAVGWNVYHASVCTATNQYLQLNTTAGLATLTGAWGAALPTLNVVGFGSGTIITANANGVAYCFAEVPGYSAFGSYTGNGDPNGPFVYLGFRPAYVLIKRSSAVESWCVMDSKREGYNVDNDPLFANLSNAEGTQDFLDLLSNGFKLRSTDTGVNGSGTYIYAAFAESPFKYSLAR